MYEMHTTVFRVFMVTRHIGHVALLALSVGCNPETTAAYSPLARCVHQAGTATANFQERLKPTPILACGCMV